MALERYYQKREKEPITCCICNKKVLLMKHHLAKNHPEIKDIYVFDFSKYKGENIFNVAKKDTSFLYWLLSRDWVKHEIKELCIHALHYARKLQQDEGMPS